MAKFTLFEIHLDDASFTSNAPFSGGSDTDDAADPAEDDEASGGVGVPVKPIAVLLVLVVLALVAKKLLGGGETDVVEIEQ